MPEFQKAGTPEQGGVKWQWNGIEWNGLEPHGMEWKGMEWNGMEWNGVEWNGIVCMEWNGMEWYEIDAKSSQIGTPGPPKSVPEAPGDIKI